MTTRLAIVNRGEAAMRLLHAVRELNARDGERYHTIALHSEEERGAMFVRQADEAYDLGPAQDRPYLDHAVLERALVATGAQAAWVGWGFVAEDSVFAELCERLGVTFVGPTPQAMLRLGDKIGAKLLAEQCGVPVAPWSNGAVEDLPSALREADRIGYPLMLKAAAGGGGRGIRMVTDREELTLFFDRTRDEARRSFGSDVVFLEALVTDARHIEVQLFADGRGGAWALGVRDCSIQRRHQKLIEESASPVLSPEQADELKQAAVRLALAADYRGAGTAEFLYRPAQRLFAFLEVNTRLQVEHPVTELVTGTDLVALQLQVAAGGRLSGPAPLEAGHAVEARLNAEDPDRDFAPAPGRIRLLRLPTGPGIRVDVGFAEGDVISAAYDSMIAKIIAYGPDREIALSRLQRALTDTQVVVEGGTTNKSFLLDLLRNEQVHSGAADTGWIDRERQAGRLRSGRYAGVAVVAAAVEAYQAALRAERQGFLATARGGRPQARHEVGRAFDLKLRGTAHRVTVARVSPAGYRVGVAGGQGTAQGKVELEVGLERLDDHAGRITIGGDSHRVLISVHPGEYQVEVEDVVHRVHQDEGGVLRSPAPALVVSVPVTAGAQVCAGDTLVVLESMKMETVLTAPVSGRVREVLVRANDQVASGQALARLEVLAEEGSPTGAGAGGDEVLADLAPVAVRTPELNEAALRELADLRNLLLGFDVQPPRLSPDGPADAADPRVLNAEIEVLQVFADLCRLSHNRAHSKDGPAGRALSPRESFHRYLHSLDADREALSEHFRERLGRVLAHYGVNEPARTPELEEAVFRIFLSQQRWPSQQAAVVALLQRWSIAPPPPASLAGRASEVLDQLVLAAQVRYPVLGDLARSIRFRWFDEPASQLARRQVYGEVEQRLAALAADPDGPGRAQTIEALAAVPEPIVRFLAEALVDGAGTVGALLEAMAIRQYHPHALQHLSCTRVAGRDLVSGDYLLDDRPSRLVSAAGRFADLDELTGLVGAQLDGGAGREAVVDLYLAADAQPASHALSSQRLIEALDGFAAAHPTRRITVVLTSERGARIERFTFRPGTPGGPALTEDTLVRGMHPMVARRLNLWRLRDFEIVRLDTLADVVLYRCLAPDNPFDVRLVAMAQVRELTMVRDDRGRVTGLPQVETALGRCLDAIRRARAADPRAGHLDMNHVWIHIWPVVEATLPDLVELRRGLAPLTVDAGLREVVVEGRVASGDDPPEPVSARFFNQPGAGVTAQLSGPPTHRLKPMDDYAQKVLRARRRGTVYPYELLPLLARGGQFVEHDLDPAGALLPVHRPPGGNSAGMVVGTVSTPTPRCPEGVTRVVLLGDPTMALGALSEAECTRVVAALDLASELGVPVEWFAISAGARISMDSGTENMDWVAAALRRIVEFTQAGGEINVVVAGINVGAQPYWNAEATMLMHTKGILVMTPDSAMVLTGKRSLDYSGGVSAEDNFGIGGYDRVMGPNGQAQYWAPDLAGAVEVLFRHYDHAYVVPGERFPRPAATADPHDRDVCASPHSAPDSDFRTVGEIFSAVTNPERKKPFDIRTVMRAVADADHEPLERWAGMAEAETSVVFDAHLGGHPVCLIGIESRQVARHGFPPSDGPDVWTAGTLFPRSSAKTARAINAASGVRPVVVLANLSGFDGSPESMRMLQLEYGAEIGRAVVNFDGPIVFCVVSRYHGGAFVVFSKTLHPQLTVLAVEGSYASVIGGAPAAGVVFSGEVDARTGADPRIRALEQQVTEADSLDRVLLRSRLTALRAGVRSEKLGEVAAEFDAVHSVERAVKVGSVDDVIPASRLRPRLIEAVAAGMAGALA